MSIATYLVDRYTPLKIAIIEALEDTEAAYNKDCLLQISGQCIFEGQRGKKLAKLSVKVCLKTQPSPVYNQTEEDMDKS